MASHLVLLQFTTNFVLKFNWLCARNAIIGLVIEENGLNSGHKIQINELPPLYLL